MKTIKLIIIAILLCQLSYAQESCMGCSKADLSGTGSIYFKTYPSGTVTYVYKSDYYSILYSLYEDVVYEQMIMCGADFMYKLYKKLDAEYIKIDKTKWRMFMDDLPIIITMSNYEGKYVFKWEVEN
jgi:hypothetical protein